MDALVFSEFMEHFTRGMRKTLQEDEDGEETLSLSSMVKNKNELASKDDDDDYDDDLLKLPDGHYLKAREAETTM